MKNSLLINDANPVEVKKDLSNIAMKLKASEIIRSRKAFINILKLVGVDHI